MRRILLSSIVSVGLLSAAAYKLPEQSIAGTAMSGASVASCDGADCAYYNSANMAFLNNNAQYIEGGFTFIRLPSVEFKGKHYLLGVDIPASGKTKIENIAIPYFHYVSKSYGNVRYGLSVTVPGGLSKRWNTPVQKMLAQEFTLKTVQVNPSVSYKINGNFSIAAGLDIVYSEGKVYSDGTLVGVPLKREMKGDSFDFGYNLALAYHSDNGLNVAATYRSKIKLTEEGKANLYIGGVGRQYDASVAIPLPASFTLALSKRFSDVEVEFDYERTFWSSYKKLDFSYKQTLPVALSAFDEPIDKKWRDTNTFRLGLKYFYSDKLTLMAGYSYDQTPIKNAYLSYELPDSNAHVFSVGFKYKQNSNLTWGVSALYDYKTKRSVNQATMIKGEFSKGGALLITAGAEYRF